MHNLSSDAGKPRILVLHIAEILSIINYRSICNICTQPMGPSADITPARDYSIFHLLTFEFSL
jgi:hypothetical protein